MTFRGYLTLITIAINAVDFIILNCVLPISSIPIIPIILPPLTITPIIIPIILPPLITTPLIPLTTLPLTMPPIPITHHFTIPYSKPPNSPLHVLNLNHFIVLTFILFILVFTLPLICLVLSLVLMRFALKLRLFYFHWRCLRNVCPLAF